MIPPRRTIGRCRPTLERLESRLALSTATGSGIVATMIAPPVTPFDASAPEPLSNAIVVATDPVSGSTIATSPSLISVTFANPVDPGSLSSFDIRVEQFVGGQWVYADTQGDQPIEAFDPSGMQLSATLSASLPAGEYRLAIDANSMMAYIDGTPVNSSGQDVAISLFTIAAQGVKLSDATDVGLLVGKPVSFAGRIPTSPSNGGSSGGVERSTTGFLDLANTPGDVKLYKFALPPGHHWRLGAEIINGLPLTTTLTLFDETGKVIASASRGRQLNDTNPFLFEGLDGGTYYVGVSGKGNIPGTTGGYDPVTGQPGTLPVAEGSGSFQLNLAADPADTATRLLGSILDHADPLDPRPTGITLAFSGPLNLETIKGDTAGGLILVGPNGQLFPVTAIGASESKGQYRFAWGGALPPGHFVLQELALKEGGLADLAGFTPVASGLPAHVLAAFDVPVAGASSYDPNNLGPIFSGDSHGVGGSVKIDAGTASSHRFVAMSDGFYQMECTYSGASMTMTVVGAGFSKLYKRADDAGLAHPLVHLKAGVYILQIGNDSGAQETVGFLLKQKTSAESILLNGVGQGPALNLRLVNPSSADFTIQSSSSGYGPAATTLAYGPQGPGAPAGLSPGGVTATPIPNSNTGSSNASNGNASNALGGVYVTLGNTLVGRPSTSSDHVSVVGPISSEGATALASNGQGLLPGIDYGRASHCKHSGRKADRNKADSMGASETPAPVNGALVSNAEPLEAPADQQVIAAADFITKLGERASRLLASLTGRGSDVDLPEETTESLVDHRDDETERSKKVEYAQFGSPLIFGAVTVMAFQYCPPLRQWVVRTRIKNCDRPGLTGAGRFRGPHKRV